MTGNKVSADKIDSLLEAIRLSASGFGLQPYKILVIENPELKAKIQPIAYGQPQAVESSHLLVFAAWNDITDPGYNQKFIGHITSGDFFEIEKFPTASFVITKVAGNQVTGNLTVKGITKSITFPAEIAVKGGKVTAKANITIDRTDFNIKYGSKKFFDSIGDKAIYDDFALTVSLVSE